MSLSTGVHPDLLKIAKTILIYKKGSKLDTSNYRPITFLSNLSKILEKLMFNFFVAKSHYRYDNITNIHVYLCLYIVNVACLFSKDCFTNFPRTFIALILLEEKSIFRLLLLRSPLGNSILSCNWIIGRWSIVFLCRLYIRIINGLRHLFCFHYIVYTSVHTV